MTNAVANPYPADWKAFIDNFPDHIACYNRNFKHLYINRAIEKEIQMSVAQVVGKSNRDLGIPMDEKALDKLEDCIRSVFQSGLPADYYTQHEFPDGTRHYYMKLTPSFLPGATQPESVWAVTRDITTLKRYENKLRQSRRSLQNKNLEMGEANAKLDTFFYTVSHDLRNPLANIKGAISLLEKVKNKQVTPFIELLHQSTQRLDDILVGLTELIEISNKDEIVDRWAFSAILATVKTEFSQQLSQIDGKIYSDFSLCPSISYVKPYLESFFRNMISNAIKYRAANRALELTITTYVQDDFVVISFQDNGMGIDLAQNAKQLFKPFYRVHQQHQEGKGMGLHIVKTMLEKNGGKIEVASQVDEGTTFRAYLKEY